MGGLIERSIDGQTDRRIDGYIYIDGFDLTRLNETRLASAPLD